MRSKEQLLRYIDSRVVDREAGGYADVDLPLEEITAHRLEIDDFPWWVSLHVTEGEDGALHLPASFVPDRGSGAWSVEVEHVISGDAWPSSRPGEDYMDALAAELVDRIPADQEVQFDGVDGPHPSEEGIAVLYRLRIGGVTLSDAVRLASSLDAGAREALRENASEDSALYPLEGGAGRTG